MFMVICVCVCEGCVCVCVSLPTAAVVLVDEVLIRHSVAVRMLSTLYNKSRALVPTDVL